MRNGIFAQLSQIVLSTQKSAATKPLKRYRCILSMVAIETRVRDNQQFFIPPKHGHIELHVLAPSSPFPLAFRWCFQKFTDSNHLFFEFLDCRRSVSNPFISFN
jgi:hypothetical protein